MSDDDLTPFESVFNKWTVAHPTRWIATTDKQHAAAFISGQTREIVRAQIEATDRVIVSQDRIASRIDEVAVAVDRVADGIEGLESAFEWGLSEIIWQLEQQRDSLLKILEVLQAPLDTQAKELKKRAEIAYRNGWIDDALEDFSDSEKKNRYDFTIHQSLGSIYLFHKKTPNKARECFEKAVKYATPKSPYHASIALLHIGLVEVLRQNYQEAYEAALKATALSPNLHEAHFQCAQYCAKLGKKDEAIEHLSKAIRAHRNYCLRVGLEKDFDPIRNRLQLFFEDLRRKAHERAVSEIEKAEQLIQWAKSCGVTDAKAREECDEAIHLLKKESVFDCEDATQWALRAAKRILRSTKKHLGKEVSRVSNEIDEQAKKLNEMPQTCGLIPASLFIGALVVLHIIYAVLCFREKSIIEGILVLLLALPINIVIMGSIGGTVLYFVGRTIARLFYRAATETVVSQHKQKLEQLQNQLTEVGRRRTDLNVEDNGGSPGSHLNY